MVLCIRMALCHVTGRPAKTVPQDKLTFIWAPIRGKDCRNPSSGSKVCPPSRASGVSRMGLGLWVWF